MDAISEACSRFAGTEYPSLRPRLDTKGLYVVQRAAPAKDELARVTSGSGPKESTPTRSQQGPPNADAAVNNLRHKGAGPVNNLRHKGGGPEGHKAADVNNCFRGKNSRTTLLVGGARPCLHMHKYTCCTHAGPRGCQVVGRQCCNFTCKPFVFTST